MLCFTEKKQVNAGGIYRAGYKSAPTNRDKQDHWVPDWAGMT